MNFTLPPGGIVGVIGPNGAGKTTLFRMLPVRKGRRASCASGRPCIWVMSTSRATRWMRKTVWERTSGGLDISNSAAHMASRAYVGAFNFRRHQQKRSASFGRQRNRVHLAKMLKSGADLLARRTDQRSGRRRCRVNRAQEFAKVP
jgi:ATPase subunit of ABC transporter with duplicated ATPase domains